MTQSYEIAYVCVNGYLHPVGLLWELKSKKPSRLQDYNTARRFAGIGPETFVNLRMRCVDDSFT
jgi:hypothetical protein